MSGSFLTARHIRAEIRKASCGKATGGLLLGGAVWCVLAGIGFYQKGSADPAALASGEVTSSMVRAWMLMLLFSAIASALVVTRDFSQGTVLRAVMAYGNRNRVFAAKIAAVGLISTAFGAVASAGAWLQVSLTKGPDGGDLIWTSESTHSLIGVGACAVIAGLWGVLIGWLVRKQALAVIVILSVVFALDPIVQTLLPDVGQYLFTMALGSVYGEPKPLLPLIPALGVLALWLALLFVCARISLTRRDLR
ncbi:hypothetical protein ACFQ71_23505 [Streptomyces sp. NPDC056534]|uniref:hypothetical protein n=1 Tax=Streptomyces sp. NPDC056534 TaxID=3345857 RepID=UPI0036C212E8